MATTKRYTKKKLAGKKFKRVHKFPRKNPKTRRLRKKYQAKENYWVRKPEEIPLSRRTIELNVIYSCCYDGIYNPEPIPLRLHKTDRFLFSLQIWSEMYLNSPRITNKITSLCDDKCRRVIGSGAQLCEDGYKIEVLDVFED